MRIVCSAMLFAALALSSLSARAAGGLFSQITPFTEPTPTADDLLGRAQNGVVLSTDGQTVLTAAPSAQSGGVTPVGKIFISQRVQGTWGLATEIDDPDAQVGDLFGSAAALSADGSVALVGSRASVSGQSGAGKAYLYTVSNGTWRLAHEFDDPMAALEAGLGATDAFGASGVALSADGKTAVIGAEGTYVNGVDGAGEIYVFTNANGVWSQTAAIPDPHPAVFDFFGLPVAISGDGNTILVGSADAMNGSSEGAVYLYVRGGGGWALQQFLADPAGTSGDYFGERSLALSYNGQTAAVGAYGTMVNGIQRAGVAYVYTDTSGAWVQSAAFPDPDGAANDVFGSSVALSSDGTTVLIGSGATVNSLRYVGKAYLYSQHLGNWVFLNPVGMANDGYGGDSVALSGDGQAALMAAGGTTVNGQVSAGEAYLYQSPADLSLTLAASPGSVTPGQQATLELTVTNTDSLVTASNVTVTDNLPTGLGFVSANAGGGSCSVTGSTITCTLASLRPASRWQPGITVSTSSNGTYNDNVSVSSSEPDPNLANNQASATVIVQSSTPPPPPGGGGAPGGGSGGGALNDFDLAVLGLLFVLGVRPKAGARGNSG